LNMIEIVNKVARKYNEDLKVRVGIHVGYFHNLIFLKTAGPVVAGIIGLKKFCYDLWGDSVNIASRMESSGQPNRVQVTETVRELLKDKFTFEERGPQTIKGKGTMKTYFVIAKIYACK